MANTLVSNHKFIYHTLCINEIKVFVINPCHELDRSQLLSLAITKYTVLIRHSRRVGRELRCVVASSEISAIV